MAKKITKKELEEPDRFQSALNEMTTYISENRSKIYWTSAIVTLIVFVACGWYLYRINYENNAQKLFAKAQLAGMKMSFQGISPDQSTLKMYQDVVTQYNGSKAAMTAYYQLGNIYFNLGNIDDAIKNYKEFINEAPQGSDLIILAFNGLGYCYEAKNDLKSALESFEKAAAIYSVGSFDGISYRNIARIYEEMKNKEKALEYYKKALSKTTDPSLEHLLKRKISTIS